MKNITANIRFYIYGMDADGNTKCYEAVPPITSGSLGKSVTTRRLLNDKRTLEELNEFQDWLDQSKKFGIELSTSTILETYRTLLLRGRKEKKNMENIESWAEALIRSKEPLRMYVDPAFSVKECLNPNK